MLEIIDSFGSAIYNWYHSLPGLLKFVLYWGGFRMYVMWKVQRELQQHDIFKDGIIKTMKKQITKLGIVGRKLAIVRHFTQHSDESPQTCRQGNCVMFG